MTQERLEIEVDRSLEEEKGIVHCTFKHPIHPIDGKGGGETLFVSLYVNKSDPNSEPKLQVSHVKERNANEIDPQNPEKVWKRARNREGDFFHTSLEERGDKVVLMRLNGWLSRTTDLKNGAPLLNSFNDEISVEDVVHALVQKGLENGLIRMGAVSIDEGTSFRVQR